jgi:hypothetical protein
MLGVGRGKRRVAAVTETLADGMNQARGMVEAAIRKIGLDPATLLTKDTAEQLAWTLKRGSAAVLIMLLRRADVASLRIVSPTVVFDPAKKEVLFTRLLELNAEGMMGCAFALVGDKIVVVTERPVVDLSEAEVSHAIRLVAGVSDTYDDKLVAEYGGKRASDT